MSEEKKVSRTSWYINTSNNNIFTESGRCKPGHKVYLSPQVAKHYNNLKLTKA